MPTLRELGYDHVDPQTWFGMFATAGTPRPVVMKIQSSVAAVFADPEFREKQVLARSFDAAVGSPEAFAAFIRADLAYKAKLIKSANVQAE